uniref:Cytochrome P450 n=1 Tax=Cuerna arida TaxID=1464854 RepID=A0A1B6GB64_9HEMI
MGLLFENILLEVLCIILLLCWIFYSNVTQKYTYWRDRGIPHVAPKFPFGTMKDVFLGKKHFGEIYEEFYKQFKGERYFGTFSMKKPTFVPRDPELIKNILTKDFHHFTDRFEMNINKKSDYIHLHLFNMSGQEWKKMRTKLTPTFTSGKMKTMFLLMSKCSEQLKEFVDEEIKYNSVLDVKDALARFTMDIIATCAFGLDINSLTDKDCEFYRIGIKVFQPTKLGLIVQIIVSLLPFMGKILSIRMASPDISDFLTRIVRETVEYREKNNVVRNDFLDLLIRIRQNKTLLDDDEKLNGNSNTEKKKSGDKEGLTIEEITAQSFIFFAAGFETASSTIAFCLYELACNPEIQDKLHQEIKEVLAKHGGKPTYQALQEMPYMDKVINETLRRYASLSILNRTCIETYKVPDSDLVLEKGQRITIPTYAIHHDPEYYPEPFKFDPERFSAERVRERHPYVYLPFGEGPRMCIGMRFGLLQTKIGLTEMLSNFEFGLSPETQVPIQIHKRAFVTQPEKPILLSLTKRK